MGRPTNPATRWRHPGPFTSTHAGSKTTGATARPLAAAPAQRETATADDVAYLRQASAALATSILDAQANGRPRQAPAAKHAANPAATPVRPAFVVTGQGLAAEKADEPTRARPADPVEASHVAGGSAERVPRAPPHAPTLSVLNEAAQAPRPALPPPRADGSVLTGPSATTLVNPGSSSPLEPLNEPSGNPSASDEAPPPPLPVTAAEGLATLAAAPTGSAQAPTTTPAAAHEQVSLDAFTALQVAAAILQPKPGAAPRPWSTWHPLVKVGVVAAGIALASWLLKKLVAWLERRAEEGRHQRGTTLEATWKVVTPKDHPASDVDALVHSGWPRSLFP